MLHLKDDRQTVTIGILENLSCMDPKIYSGSLGYLEVCCGGVSTSGNHLTRKIGSLCGEPRDRDRWTSLLSSTATTIFFFKKRSSRERDYV